MKYIFLFIFLFIASRFSYADSIIVDGLERTYIIHLPAGKEKAAGNPLVLALHGGGGKGSGMNKLSGFDDVSDERGFVVVYPDGVDKQWNDGRDDFHLNNDINDVKFISCLIDTLKVLYNIDSNRVYVTGISNGGIMSFRLACELSNKIAAFAPVAASMPLNPSYDCKPVRPVPMMLIFGEDDPLIPFGGGDISILGLSKRGKVIPVNESVNYWVKFNGSNTIPEETTIDKADDETSVVKKVYSASVGGAEVQFWLVKGGGHCWPGGFQYLPKLIIGRTSKEFNATEEIWKFFSAKSLH